MLTAKSAAPISNDWWISQPVCSNFVRKPVSIVQAPPGYFLADGLAQLLRKEKSDLLWLRFDQGDNDPARILLSLIRSARQKITNIGSHTIQLMKSRPGPIYGWSALYQCLGEEFDNGLPADCAIVLEHVHLAHKGVSGFQPLITNLLGNRSNDHLYILTSLVNIPKSVLPAYACVIGIQDLQVDIKPVEDLAMELEIDMPAQSIQRMVALLAGREVPIRGIFQACFTLGSLFVRRLIQNAKDGDHLQIRIAEALLSLVRPEELVALSLVWQLPYSHPKLLQVVLGSGNLAEGPWVQSLEGDWSRLRNAWQPALRNTLIGRPFSDQPTIHRAAEFFSDQAELEYAIQILLNAKEYPDAAELITRVAEEMIDLGQWATLERWLSFIPAAEIINWPWLSYVRAELYAGTGQLEEAKHYFMISHQSFLNHFHPQRACQSLLAASFLAAKQGNTDQAVTCALRAEALTREAEIPDQLAWISYQLGCLVAKSGDQNAALGFFSQAIEKTQDAQIMNTFKQAGALAARRRELDIQKSYHLRALDEIARDEHDLSDQFQRWVGMPFEDLPSILQDWGWFNTPLALKAACLPKIPIRSSVDNQKTPWGKWLTRLRKKSAQAKLQTDDHVNLPMKMESLQSKFLNGGQGQSEQTINLHEIETEIHENPPQRPAPNIYPGLLAGHEAAKLNLSAFMLGSFRLVINYQPIYERTSSRALAMVKYMLAHHDQVIPREVLMETFWPDVTPEAARNNLNVAMHNLRQLLHTVTLLPVIVYMFGNYAFSDESEIWIDLDEFDRRMKLGEHIIASGQIEPAVKEFEVAVNLYQGDFLAEDPYEEWTILPRERTRLAYLNLLDRLGQIYFIQERYMTCVTICQQMLERDNCREDAHRRLMMCYSRQGQTHLALRQYQICVEALRAELDIDPEPATNQLAVQIRRRESV